MGESKTEERIKKRFDQTISTEDLETYGVLPNCATCPRVAYEYCQLRNSSKDATFSAAKEAHTNLQAGLEEFPSPTSTLNPDDLQDLLGEYVAAVENHQAEQPFAESFAVYLSELGTAACEGVIVFDEVSVYQRRYTRDRAGRPVLGEATEICALDAQYVRDSKGYADLALRPVDLTNNV